MQLGEVLSILHHDSQRLSTISRIGHQDLHCMAGRLKPWRSGQGRQLMGEMIAISHLANLSPISPALSKLWWFQKPVPVPQQGSH